MAGRRRSACRGRYQGRRTRPIRRVRPCIRRREEVRRRCSANGGIPSPQPPGISSGSRAIRRLVGGGNRRNCIGSLRSPQAQPKPIRVRITELRHGRGPRGHRNSPSRSRGLREADLKPTRRVVVADPNESGAVGDQGCETGSSVEAVWMPVDIGDVSGQTAVVKLGPNTPGSYSIVTGKCSAPTIEPRPSGIRLCGVHSGPLVRA